MLLFSLEAYTKKRDGYRTDLAQFHDLIDQMDNHVKMLSQKKLDRTMELDESKAQLTSTTSAITELENSIRFQELNLEAARSLQITFKGMCEGIERATSSNNSRRKTVNENTTDLQALWNKVEEFVSIYNASIQDFATLVPPSLSAFSKLNICDNCVFSGSQKLGIDLEDNVRLALGSSKADVTSALSTSKSDIQRRLDALGKCDGSLAVATGNLKILGDKISSKTLLIEEERDLNSAKCSVRLREAESLESKISSLRDPVGLEERMAQYERQCTELELLRLKNQEDRTTLTRAILAEIEIACTAMDQFDKFYASSVSEIQKYRSASRLRYERLSSNSRAWLQQC